LIRSTLVLTVVAVIVAIAVLRVGVTPTAGQAQSFVAPRTADGKPNLNGVWQALTTANYDLQDHPARPAMMLRKAPPRTAPAGLGRSTPTDLPALPVLAFGAVGGVPAGRGVVDGNDIPYQDWARAKKQENADNWVTRDPEIKCYLPGVPRATYLPYPFQILQGTDKILIAYEFAGATRTIHLDQAGESPSDTWMGWSKGRWDGDTLVVDVGNFNDQTWFDRAGNFHSEALHVTERYTPASPYHLMYEATIEDPKVFTRPWTIRLPLYRRFDKDAQIREYKCVEFVEQLMYGQLGVVDPATGQRNR
jgi:hypothetical protein